MVKVAIFDVDQTLYPFRPNAEAAERAATDFIARRWGVDPGRALAAWRNAFRWQFTTHPERPCCHDRASRFQRALEELGLPPVCGIAVADAYWEAFFADMRLFPGVAEFLEAIRANGVRVGVGTNMSAERQLRKLDRLGLAPCIDFVVTSEEADAEKPDPGFFSLVLEKAGVAPDECVFAGDDLNRDALGGASAGMHGVWIQPDLALRASEMRVPSVASVVDLPSLFPELLAAPARASAFPVARP